jgi:hypothetical protein
LCAASLLGSILASSWRLTPNLAGFTGRLPDGLDPSEPN